jgi:soluble lytic murein transglycosylase-like protein
MSRRSSRFSLAFLPLLLSGAAGADVFKYVDAAGHVHYTDKPPHAGYRMIIKTPGSALRLAAPAMEWSAGTRTLRLGPPPRAAGRRSQYTALIEEAAGRYNLDPALLHAVIKAESGYNPNAVSHKGAIGLMQLMPGTAARYGVEDPYDPADNIGGGARYLSDLIAMFPSDIRLAVAAYNAGEKNVIKYGNTIPPFPETRQYVSRVLDYYSRFN